VHVLVFYPLLTRLHIQDLHYIYAILTFPLPQENEALASAHNCSNQGQFFSPVLLFCFCFESVGEPEFESVGEPEFESVGEPEFESVGEPEFESVDKPEFESVGKPEFESVCEPEFESFGEPEFESVGKPEFESVGKPEFESVGKPEFESVGEPEFESVGEPEFFSRYCDSLRARRFGDRVPVRARFSAPVQIGAGDHPVSYTMGTGRKAARAWSRQPISN